MDRFNDANGGIWSCNQANASPQIAAISRVLAAPQSAGLALVQIPRERIGRWRDHGVSVHRTRPRAWDLATQLKGFVAARKAYGAARTVDPRSAERRELTPPQTHDGGEIRSPLQVPDDRAERDRSSSSGTALGISDQSRAQDHDGAGGSDGHRPVLPAPVRLDFPLFLLSAPTSAAWNEGRSRSIRLPAQESSLMMRRSRRHRSLRAETDYRKGIEAANARAFTLIVRCPRDRQPRPAGRHCSGPEAAGGEWRGRSTAIRSLS